uniref:RDD family protein n=1 Tax=Hydatigena taeniaeformis TaxID=6205 RepID=A0A0R3WQ63_HYDTA
LGPTSGTAPVGWNIDQTIGSSGSVPYPHDDGGGAAAPGSGWTSQNPSAPPPPYAPPYPQ